MIRLLLLAASLLACGPAWAEPVEQFKAWLWPYYHPIPVPVPLPRPEVEVLPPEAPPQVTAEPAPDVLPTPPAISAPPPEKTAPASPAAKPQAPPVKPAPPVRPKPPPDKPKVRTVKPEPEARRASSPPVSCSQVAMGMNTIGREGIYREAATPKYGSHSRAAVDRALRACGY